MRNTTLLLISILLLTASVIRIDGIYGLQSELVPAISKIDTPSVGRTWDNVHLIYPDTFHDTAKLNEEITNINSTASEIVDLRVIGQSYQGKNTSVLTITNENDDSQKAKTLVVSHHHGREQITVELALRFVLMLVNGYGVDSEITNYVDTQEVFVIPTLNPDALDIVVNEGNHWLRKNLRPYDNDGDGFFDEDPVEDANGDGIISGYDIYRKLTGDDKRYIESYYEGFDNDKDGLVNEDGVGLVDLNRNYPTYFGDPGSSSNDPSTQIYHGSEPFSEPETAAFRDFVLKHRFAMAYSLHSGINATYLPTNNLEHWELPSLYSDIISDYSSFLPSGFNEYLDYAPSTGISGSVESGLAGGWKEWMYNERGTIVPITFEVYRNATSESPELSEIIFENSTHLIEKWDGIYPYFNPLAEYIDSLWIDLRPAFDYLLEMTPRLDIRYNSITETAEGVSIDMNIGTLSPRLGTIENVKMIGESGATLKTWLAIEGETRWPSDFAITLPEDWKSANYTFTIGNNYTGVQQYLIHMREAEGFPVQIVIGIVISTLVVLAVAWYLLKGSHNRI